MIKPHTAAKQETKLLGIRGEEKVNEKESESNKGNERRQGEREEEHRREKPLW